MSVSVANDANTEQHLSAAAYWGALFEPAWQPHGPLEFAWPLRIVLDSIRNSVACSLRQVFQKFVRINRGRGLPKTERDTVYEIRLQVSFTTRPIRLVLDVNAARAMVDAVTTQISGLRGRGQLTPCELGALDYIVLRCVDELSSTCFDAQHAVQLVGMGGLEAKPHGAGSHSTRADEHSSFTAYELQIGARQGHIYVDFSALNGVDLPFTVTEFCKSINTCPDASKCNRKLPVHLSWPAICVSATETDSMQPGDLLLTGCAEFDAMPSSFALATDTGWRLCDANIACDKSNAITVQCGPLNPRPQAMAAESRAIVLDLRMGTVALGLESITRWQPRQALTLGKDQSQPLSLYRGGKRIATGELVRADGELAMHILTLDQPARN